MKAVEFCYWLQGYFEIGDANRESATALDDRAVRCIKSHLELVARVEPEHGNVFVEWLDMFLRNVGGVQPKGVEKIRRLLAAQFKHVIDPSYGGDQKALQQAHDNGEQPQIGGVKPEGDLYRC